ncbi:MAG: diadenylate cyclase [Archaeoglobi archaeon]|nr:diadenylate cyclase [Archaeoglobi archaeon]MDK2781368.1 diadenylate cyclase [Archaeoglobi archaeon]
MREDLVKAAIELARRTNASLILDLTPERILEDVEIDIPVIFCDSHEISEDRNTGVEFFFNRTVRSLKSFRDLIYRKILRGELEEEGIVIAVHGDENMGFILSYDLSKSATFEDFRDTLSRVDPFVLHSAITLAMEIGREGREGQQIGTAFIIGDEMEVLKRSHQLILNPFEGHPPEVRDIKNRENWEAIKEFAQLDGVFIISSDGIVISAGRYLDVDARGVRVRAGLGGRHIAAAAITRETEAIAVTVSKSGGIVRVYKDGEEIMEIDPNLFP